MEKITPPPAKPDMSSSEVFAYVQQVREVLAEYGYVVRKADLARRKTKQAYPNAYTDWLAPEVKTLVRMFKEGATVEQLSETLQRTPSAIMAYLCKLDLTVYDKDAKGWVLKRSTTLYVSYCKVKWLESMAREQATKHRSKK